MIEKGRNAHSWTCALGLDASRCIIEGDAAELANAVRQGCDLRIYTEFVHNEHVDTNSDNNELVQEVSDFRVTYLLDDRWAAGIMTLRMPITPPEGFGDRPSMSFFLYNQDGRQAIARPFLDGRPTTGQLGPAPRSNHSNMPKYHEHDNWDEQTNAPSSNFTYDFETFRFLVRDDWREVYGHDANGTVTSGCLEDLVESFSDGCEIKVGIHNLCRDLDAEIAHEVFVQTGPGYYSTERKLFCAGSQPVVRVKPNIPLQYESRGWDFGWLMPRTDGLVARWLCDPYTLQFHKSQRRHAMRWFVR